jgi:DNA-binding PucR family transcriptional regulator
VRPLERDGRAGATVLETVQLYLEHDCQVPETAAELGVHPNTVRYRVGRFEHATGCSLRHTESLVEAWWALRRHRAR